MAVLSSEVRLEVTNNYRLLSIELWCHEGFMCTELYYFFGGCWSRVDIYR